MKATELLTTQHQEVNALFEQIEQAEGEAVRPLVEELVANIVAHSMIEKEIYYVAAAEVPENAKLLSESAEEHALVEFTMQKLLSAEPGDETFHARVTVLKELLQHHMQEEQEELFPRTEQAMAEQMEELGQVMEQRFELLKAGDVRGMLAEAVQEAMPPMPTTRRRSQATKQGGRRTGTRAASKRTTGQRASGGGRSTTKRSTTAAKRSTTAKRSSTSGQGTGSRASTSTGRKQSASKSSGGSKSARGAQGRSNASRTQRQAAGAKGGRRSGGRSSSSR